MPIVDLTGPIYEGMWTYGPPLPEVRLARLAKRENEGWDAHLLHMANVQGTSIETGAHLLAGHPTIDQLPPKRFFIRCAVLQLPEKGPREHITAAEFEAAGVQVGPGMGLLAAVGWDRMWRRDTFFWDSPHFTAEAMDWVVRRRPAVLGLDIPSANDPYTPEGLLLPLFDVGALVLAPLANLRGLRKPYVDLIALPLKIEGFCATPCRAVAIE